MKLKDIMFFFKTELHETIEVILRKCFVVFSLLYYSDHFDQFYIQGQDLEYEWSLIVF